MDRSIDCGVLSREELLVVYRRRLHGGEVFWACVLNNRGGMSFAVVVQYFSKVSHILCLSRREFVTYWPLPLVWLICVMYGRAVSSSVWCLDFPDQLGTTELSLWSLFLNLTWLLYL